MFALTWHSYASHFKDVLGNLFATGESSDVTLVCDDQVKYKAHKFVLKGCSKVFENILTNHRLTTANDNFVTKMPQSFRYQHRGCFQMFLRVIYK